jgi:hypothetical protein
MSAGHTPGPWFVARKAETGETIIEVAGELGRSFRTHWVPVCTMEMGEDWDAETVAANARLIACAPDLMKVMEELLWLRTQEFKSAVKKKNAYERAMCNSLTAMRIIEGMDKWPD